MLNMCFLSMVSMAAKIYGVNGRLEFIKTTALNGEASEEVAHTHRVWDTNSVIKDPRPKVRGTGRLKRPANPRAGVVTSSEMSGHGCTSRWSCAGRVASLKCAPPRRQRPEAAVGVASAAASAVASASAAAMAAASREVAAAAGASPMDRQCWAAAARRMACRHGGAERRRTPSAECWRGWSRRPRRWSCACRAAARAGTAGGAGRGLSQPICRSTERCAVESYG